MKTKIAFVNLIIFALICFGCQKLDLKRDGYFILKANGKRIAYNKCYSQTTIDNSGSSPVYFNEICAYTRDANTDSIRPKILIYFNGNTIGSYTTYNPSQGLLAAIIHFNNNIYEFPMYNSAVIDLEIDKYNTSAKEIKGSLSGKFYNVNNSSDFIDVKKSDFCARGGS